MTVAELAGTVSLCDCPRGEVQGSTVCYAGNLQQFAEGASIAQSGEACALAVAPPPAAHGTLTENEGGRSSVSDSSSAKPVFQARTAALAEPSWCHDGVGSPASNWGQG